MVTKTYKELWSTHQEYDPELNKKLKLLYEGGFEIMKEENATLFLKRLDQLEKEKAYKNRLSCAAYIPYLSQFITTFTSSLFSVPMEVKAQGDAFDKSTSGEDMTDDFYKDFLEDCDQQHRTYHQLSQDIAERALSELCVYVCMDFPKGERINRAQEKANGLDKGYAYLVPYCNVIDWKIDESNNQFIWTKEYEEVLVNDDPMVEPMHYFQFRMRKLFNGKGGWTVLKCDPMKLDKLPTDKTKFSTDPDQEHITSFPEVNLWKFSIERAYHVGQQIGPICQEYFQRRSFLVSNCNKTCVSVGTITIGPDIGAPGDSMPNDLDTPQEAMELRKQLENEGWLVLRKTDKWQDEVKIVEARGESHKAIVDQLTGLVESMMQTLRQMNMTASANKKAVGRSAASKEIDKHGTQMLLTVYKHDIQDFTKLLFMKLASGRGEDIRFAVEGLTTAEPSYKRDETVKEVQGFGLDIMKFPEMWKNKYLNQIATELIDNNITDKEREELQDQILEKIQEGDFDQLNPVEAYSAGNKVQKGAAIAQDKGALPASDNSDGGDNEQMPMGPAGQPLAPETAHLQTGQHVDSKVVHSQLSDDYKSKDIEFIKHIPWKGPMEVPLSSIDFSNKDNWQASQEPDKVEKFADMMKNEQFTKPIVLFNNPSNDNKMQVGDGHHRALAAMKNGTPVNAYIGEVGSDEGPWDKLHNKQTGSVQGSNQKSMQKQVSNQVKNSENPNA